VQWEGNCGENSWCGKVLEYVGKNRITRLRSM
jgi:hypothetical protein